MCVGFSFGGTRNDNELVLARKGYSAQVFTIQTCERVCVCLHIGVVMQALMNRTGNVSLLSSDQSVCSFLFLSTVKQNNVFSLLLPGIVTNP